MRSASELSIDESNPVGTLFPIEKNPGVSHSGHERNHLFMNRGGLQFADVSGLSGLDDGADGRVLALLDFDRDGWQDIAVVNANNPLLRLYRNQIGDHESSAAAGRSVAVRFMGGNRSAEPVSGWSCREGYGAKVRVDLGDRQILREHRCGEGMAAQNSANLLIGIGNREKIASLTVEWPSGSVQKSGEIAAGSQVTVYENPSHSPSGEAFVVERYSPPVRVLVASDGDTRTRTSAKLLLASATSRDEPARLKLYTTMATWCAVCKGELPQLAKLRETFAAEELGLFGVPVDENDGAEKLADYVAVYHPAYRMLDGLSRREVENVKQAVERELHIPDAMPATVIVDSQGTVLHATTGVPSISDLRRLLSRH